MSSKHLLISDLPDDVIFTILGYLSYENVAQIRIVNSFFNQLCKQHLNQGFYKVKKVLINFFNNLRSNLPRRHSARQNHPYAKHCLALNCQVKNICKLSATFGKYMEASLCCFIPGKIIDEVYKVLKIVRVNLETPEDYEKISVLNAQTRDLFSMANGHFKWEIEPALRLQLQKLQKEAEESPRSSTDSVPIFSLYGQNRRNRPNRPVLSDLIEVRNSSVKRKKNLFHTFKNGIFRHCTHRMKRLKTWNESRTKR